MLFLVGVALAVVAGWIAGGRLARLASLRIAWLWAAPVALALQIFVVFGPGGLDRQLAVGLIVASHALLLTIALRNVARLGAAIAAVGLALNLAVMVANGGLMPVAPETLAMAGRIEPWKVGDGSVGTWLANSKDVILPRDQTVLEPLADRYWTGLPGRLGVIFSLGDVVLLAGVSVLVFRGMTSSGAPVHTILPHPRFPDGAPG